MPHENEHVFKLKDLLPGDYYCSGCAERVCASAVELDGVDDASCDLEAGELTVAYEPRTISARDLAAAVRRLALEETDRVGHAVYRVTGLD